MHLFFPIFNDSLRFNKRFEFPCVLDFGSKQLKIGKHV